MLTRVLRGRVAPAAAAMLCLGLASLPALASPTGRLHHLEQRRSEVHRRISHLSHRGAGVAARVKELDARRAEAERRVARLDGRLRSLGRRVDSIRSRLEDAERRLARIHRHVLTIQARLVHRSDVFTRRARAIYESGPDAMWEGLLSSHSFGDFVDRYTYYQSALAGDHELLHEITVLRNDMLSHQDRARRQKRSLERAETALKQEKARLAEARRKRAAELARRRQAVADKAALLDRIRRSKAASKRVAEQIDSEVQKVRNIIAAAEAAAAAAARHPAGGTTSSVAPTAPPVPETGGQLAWPAVGPVTSGFGMRVDPVTHRFQMHTGIDIGAPEGAPVSAAGDGTVIYVGTMAGYGNVVVIDHGGGLSTLYGHLSAYGVTTGEHVARGSPIANVGCTGWCTGPHLHFEVRVDGNPVDPMPYLS